MKNSNNFDQLLRKPSLVDEIERELAKRSLRANSYAWQAWPVLEPSTPFVPGFHIDAIIDHLGGNQPRGSIRNLLINVAAHHMKSLLVSVFWPAWEWIQWPERRWLYSSYAATLSIRDSVKCRTLIMSPWYEIRWGNVFGALTGDQNTKGRFDNTRRRGIVWPPPGGGAATGEGGDRLVCDDPHNVQEPESESVRKGTLVWMDVVMSTRQNDPRSTSKTVVMQRCHQRDLSGHLLEQGGWEHLCLPAEYEATTRVSSIGFSDLRTEPGELLWPERFGHIELTDLKRSMGSYAAAGQLQQRPSPAEGGMIKRYWFRYWQHRQAHNLPPILVMVRTATERCPLIAHGDPGHIEEMSSSRRDCAFKRYSLETIGVHDRLVIGMEPALRLVLFATAAIQLKSTRAWTFRHTSSKAVREYEERCGFAAEGSLTEDKANGVSTRFKRQDRWLTRSLAPSSSSSPAGGKIARASERAVLVSRNMRNVLSPTPTDVSLGE